MPHCRRTLVAEIFDDRNDVLTIILARAKDIKGYNISRPLPDLIYPRFPECSRERHLRDAQPPYSPAWR